MESVKQIASDSNIYQKHIGKKWLFFFLLIFILFITALISISIGSSGLSLSQIIRALFGGGDDLSRGILWNVRMPRVATAIGVGVALALAGCIMQNVLRNPLASASTLGVMQGASFGAAVAIIYFQAGVTVSSTAGASIAISNPYIVVISAFIGGIITTTIILLLARVAGISPTTMILAGVAIGAMFTGATTIIQYFSDDTMVASVVYWTFGNLGRAGWNEIGLIYLVCALALIYFIYNRWNYNALESGTNTAKSLGVNVNSLIIISMIVATLIAATAVAFVGTIGFVGLIAPHIVRRFIGNDYRYLIPCSAVMGAIIMLIADLVSRVIIMPAILPIGAITTFIGAPLFLYLIIRKGKGLE